MVHHFDDVSGYRLRQKGNGKLVVYLTSTDSGATLNLTAIPVASDQPPIGLGVMSKTEATGNEFFAARKIQVSIASIQITSSSGGALAASLKGH